MPPSTLGPPFDQFLATAEAVAKARPEVDLEMAREVFQEAATLVDNGLVLDGLDEHDAVPLSPGCASTSLPRIPALRCAHVPRQRWRVLEICTTQRVCQRPT